MCSTKNEGITTEIEDVLASLNPQIEARDEAKAALESNQTEQERLNRRVRELDGLVHQAQKNDRGGAEALRMINDANMEAKDCSERLSFLRSEEQGLRSVLAKTQFELNQAVIRVIQPLREQQQAQVSALVDQAYHITDAWRAAVDRIAHEHGITYPSPRHVALNVLCHERISKDRFGVPPFEQVTEAANA